MTVEDRTRKLVELTRINDQWIKTIDDYHFPVVTLSDTTEPDALCTIFETLNRTGVKLSVFELLTARFWPKNIDLRGLWDKALADHPVIADFGVDPYYVLQGISLAVRTAPSCRIDDHHVFPAAYLERRGVTPTRARDCVLNRTLIDRTTNQMIRDRAPSDYLTEIRGTSGFPFEAVLGSHTLPTGEGSPLLRDDYATFLTWRQDRLWQEIRQVTGATTPTDLEAAEDDGRETEGTWSRSRPPNSMRPSIAT